MANPHDSICLMAHSPALFRLGEPVSRGPYTSVRTCSVFMIWEFSVASRRIFHVMSREAASSARTVMEATATAPATKRAFRNVMDR